MQFYASSFVSALPLPYVLVPHRSSERWDVFLSLEFYRLRYEASYYNSTGSWILYTWPNSIEWRWLNILGKVIFDTQSSKILPRTLWYSIAKIRQQKYQHTLYNIPIRPQIHPPKYNYKNMWSFGCLFLYRWLALLADTKCRFCLCSVCCVLIKVIR